MTEFIAHYECDCGAKIPVEFNILCKNIPFLKLFSCGECGNSWYAIQSDGRVNKMQDKTKDIQLEILATFQVENPPATVRHIYYRISGKGLVPKNDKGYRAVQTQTKKMRLVGSLPYSWIADPSRSFYQPRTYRNVSDALQNMQEFYRKSLWFDSPDYVQIWVEKLAMLSVIHPITDKWDVQLCPAKGYSSMSFIAETAEAIKQSGKNPFVYYFCDFDYDGIYAAEFFQQALWERHGVEINFQRVCVTEEQIAEHNLQTRPPNNHTKKKWSYDYAVDIDTLSPGLVRQLVEDCITRHLPRHEFNRLQEIEEQEKETLQKFCTSTIF